METMKRKWGKPVMEVQRFVPNYCQDPCTVPESYLRVWVPVKEDNGLEGWQQHNAPAGYAIDSNGRAYEGYWKLYGATYEHITVDKFNTDDTNSYWMITISKDSPNEAGTLTLPAGSIVYKNYGGGIQSVAPEVEKNFS